MTTTNALAPHFSLTFGRTATPPVLETWMERCDEFGCRCVLMEQLRYEDVVELAEAEDTQTSFANAVLTAERTITLWTAEELPTGEPAAEFVVMGTVSDGTGRTFTAFGWMGLAEARAYLLEIASWG